MVGDQPHSVDAADIDNDGDLDLVIAHWTFDFISTHLNDGTGNFSSGQSLPASYASAAYFVDPDKDGDLDVICANRESNSIGFFNN